MYFQQVEKRSGGAGRGESVVVPALAQESVQTEVIGERLHVVGEKFAAFAADNPGVRTILELEHDLATKKYSNPVELIIGQGVTLERLLQLEKRIAADELHEIIRIVHAPVRQRASGKYTHKHYDRNTIITTPEKVSESKFVAQLVLDDGCAEMSDHMTGHHLQGVVFFEGARQLFLAATERFWLENLPRPYYFVINDFNIAYHTFGFPLPTTLEMEISSVREDVRGTGGLIFEVTVIFLQNAVPITTCVIKYAAFDKVLLSAREGLLSRLGLARVSSRLDPSQNVSHHE